MPRGGSKPGERRGGRAKGVKNHASIARQAEISATGVTPLAVMIENMRFAHSEAARLVLVLSERKSQTSKSVLEMKELKQFRMMAQECAKDAAPYIHPRLAAVEHSGQIDAHITHEQALKELE